MRMRKESTTRTRKEKTTRTRITTRPPPPPTPTHLRGRLPPAPELGQGLQAEDDDGDQDDEDGEQGDGAGGGRALGVLAQQPGAAAQAAPGQRPRHLRAQAFGLAHPAFGLGAQLVEPQLLQEDVQGDVGRAAQPPPGLVVVEDGAEGSPVPVEEILAALGVEEAPASPGVPEEGVGEAPQRPAQGLEAPAGHVDGHPLAAARRFHHGPRGGPGTPPRNGGVRAGRGVPGGFRGASAKVGSP